jgi:hypothetical protein
MYGGSRPYKKYSWKYVCIPTSAISSLKFIAPQVIRLWISIVRMTAYRSGGDVAPDLRREREPPSTLVSGAIQGQSLSQLESRLYVCWKQAVNIAISLSENCER